ncbi:MAG TPA: HD domain-containing phosphohydrolase [Candidatus Dormibacteraeota bacterium]|nr:HD domain-containing phosphohydrolase [Candidatus Dormibacteraeota bacterium]
MQQRQASHGAPLVLVVDDGETNRALVEAFLSDLDCRLESVEDGPSALASIDREPPDLVLLDVQMPGMDGYEVCRAIKARPRGHLLPVVMLTALDNATDRVLALEAGADDFMSKPVDRVELVARVRSALRLKAVYDTLDSAEQVIFSLAAAVEAKDKYTEKHTHRVAETARHVGEKMGLPERALDALYRGGMIHDIGKIGVPDAILLKPGPLSGDELRIMRAHTTVGESIVRPLRSGTNLLPIVRNHHEHFDGNGYPDGLAGRAIPRLARIVAVCDSYDALVTDRPYRKARSVEDAIATLVDGAGRQWDPEVVEVLVGELSNITAVGVA